MCHWVLKEDNNNLCVSSIWKLKGLNTAKSQICPIDKLLPLLVSTIMHIKISRNGHVRNACFLYLQHLVILAIYTGARVWKKREGVRGQVRSILEVGRTY
jgi:ribosomal protein L19